MPGAWDAAYARWLFEQLDLFDVVPVDLLATQDPEVPVAANASRSRIVLCMPHVYGVTLNVDLSEYRCRVFDLEKRRPMGPSIEAGSHSTVRASIFNGDGLFLAVRESV